ncbi:MAG TPA: hypothetical protein DDZ76_10400 [Xanthomonadales bacterium]|nr:hypothetical protein [Xanthomonadales bacterium]
MFGSWNNEIRHSLRGLLARPMLTLVAVATLALGIGANTAIFSVMHGLFLAPLPYPDGERLVEVYNSYPNTPGLAYAGTSIPDYLDRREQVQSLEDMALFTWTSFNLASEGGSPEHLRVLKATPSLFSTLQTTASLGRVFEEGHAIPGEDRVVVLSHALWQNRFGADPAIVGRDVRLSGQPYRVIGVMPEGFAFPERDIRAWVPFAFTPEQRLDTERGNEYSASIGRLQPGASIERLHAELDAVVARTAERVAAVPDERARGYAEFLRGGNFTGRAERLRDRQVGSVRPMVLLLQVAVALVLLIATTNIANLLLGRMLGRQRELAVRSALGASRRRLARQALTETLLLAVLGGGFGVVLAYALIDVLPMVGIDVASGGYRIDVSLPVLLFAVLATVVSAMVAALVPVLGVARIDLGPAARDGSRGSGGRGAAWSRAGLAAAQVAVATTLLIGAGLMTRSFAALQAESPGFRSDGVITARVELPASRYSEQEARSRFYAQALEGLGAIPGVESAAFVSVLPLAGDHASGSYRIDGRDVVEGQSAPHGHQRYVSESYFSTLGIPVLKGRGLLERDRAGAEPVVVIDQRLADTHFAGIDPIGQRILRRRDEPAATIVGVVGSVRHDDLRDPIDKETLYWPVRQHAPGGGVFVLRNAGSDPGVLIPAIRRAILAVDPEQPVHDIKTLDQRVALTLDRQRAPMLLIGFFAAVAILLAVLGVYGVLAFAVGQRRTEFGIRMAIGAPTARILSLVLRQGLRLSGAGLAVGIVFAWAVAQALQSQLHGISARDPATYGLVAAILLLIAMAASILPALRAGHTDPIDALRSD